MEIQAEVERLIHEIEVRRAMLTKLLKDLRAAREASGWDAVALVRTLELARNSAAAENELKSMIVNAHLSAERAASAAFLEMEADVRELCEHRGWRVDGQWPRLYVERAVHLEVDDKTRGVVVGGVKLENFTKRGLDRALEGAVKALLPRGFEPERFIAQLSEAYDEVCGGRGREAPLLRVYRSLVLLAQPSGLWRDARASNFREFTAEQFRARLSAALEAGAARAPDGRELRLLPPIDPKDAMFIYQPSERRFAFVGRIEFRSFEERQA